MEIYCANEICVYNEDGCCEHEGALNLDKNGLCMSYRHKNTETEN